MAGSASTSFQSLHPTVQRWIWDRGWTELRDAQERAIPVVLDGKCDLIIAAATASGKTEAAFLPIASRLLQMHEPGLAVYVSPLKALINDQWARMGELFSACELPVYPWHGDISGSRKMAFEKQPIGALLITPESLESIFVRRGFHVGRLFQRLSVVVVDELHSFINSERGFQLASLLSRLETAIGRTVQRIGLSATLGDLKIAAEALRPGGAGETVVIESSAAGQELRLIVKGYIEPGVYRVEEAHASTAQDSSVADVAIAKDLSRALRGSTNLVFANSRQRVEQVTDRLVRLCEHEQVPNEFYAHHGSLSKALREETEARLKERDRPATAVCTSTLEMGIDIGQAKSVCQIDPPFSVASLRQRWGRSGRRGEPAILRMYVTEQALDNRLAPQDSLRLGLFQTAAAVNLLLHKWCEPAQRTRLHLSTLIQQVLSLIAERGGITAKEAWTVLCKVGPFRNVDPQAFADLLRSLAEYEILMQAADGTLLHAPVGERIVNHYSFYAAFQTADEFKVVNGSELLGSLPITRPVPANSFLLFGGRRWRVISVDDDAKVIAVVPAPGGKAPTFCGTGGSVHRRIHEEMKRLYESDELPRYLDREAMSLLHEGREQYRKFGLGEFDFVPYDGSCLFFLWAGSLVSDTLLVHLQSLGYTGFSFDVGLCVGDISPDELRSCLREIAAHNPPDSEALADSVPNRQIDRYDHLLPSRLLSQNYASAALVPEEAWEVLRTRSAR